MFTGTILAPRLGWGPGVALMGLRVWGKVGGWRVWVERRERTEEVVGTFWWGGRAVLQPGTGSSVLFLGQDPLETPAGCLGCPGRGLQAEGLWAV